MRKSWANWDEAFIAYRLKGHAIDVAAIKAEEWEMRHRKTTPTTDSKPQGGVEEGEHD